MDEIVLTAALAGLVHDIGKFAQRAGERGTRLWDDEARRDYKYMHALLTGDFVEQYAPAAWRLPVKNLAANHHRPTAREEDLLRLADQLSAGERARDVEPEHDERKLHPRQVRSIFYSLVGESGDSSAEAYLPLETLHLEEKALFPGAASSEDEAWRRYERMWEEFLKEAKTLQGAHSSGRSLAAYLESMLLLLQRYTWCIPSAYYKADPDVSLHDHGRMTASLAAILVGLPLSDDELQALKQAPAAYERPVARLVGGDISGVQDFIYTITAQGANRSLRGRSFYLQLLTEATARYTLRRLELPITNLVYAGGGHFYLLARPSDDEALEEVQREVSQALLRHHRGELYLALASIPLNGADFYAGRLSERWGELSAALQIVKQRRFSELGADLKLLFQPQGHGGNQERSCQVCGQEHPDTREIDEVRKCPPCVSYETLGEDLRQARYLVLELHEDARPAAWEPAEPPGGYEETLAEFGIKAKVEQSLPGLPTDGTRRLVFALADEALTGLHPGELTAVGRRFLVNVAPTLGDQEVRVLKNKGLKGLRAGSIKPFDAMQAQARGIPRLGVLRMDVDDLGRLFSEGLGTKATLSRVAALSFAVSLFFEGWVGALAARRNAQGRKDAQRGERLYAIYSGGDDLFFVGSWDEVVELAREMRADLARFSAGHPALHASGGLALVGGKYPLAQAAEDALRAEEQAKSLQWWDDQGRLRRKDALAFLGQALPWERFGLGECDQPGRQDAHALMHRLADMVQKQGASRSLPRLLIRLHERYQTEAEKRRREGRDQTRAGSPQTLWGPWNWLAIWYLTRMAEERKPALKAEIESLRNLLRRDDFRSIEWIGLAARWAELLTRGSQNN